MSAKVPTDDLAARREAPSPPRSMSRRGDGRTYQHLRFYRNGTVVHLSNIPAEGETSTVSITFYVNQSGLQFQRYGAGSSSWTIPVETGETTIVSGQTMYAYTTVYTGTPSVSGTTRSVTDPFDFVAYNTHRLWSATPTGVEPSWKVAAPWRLSRRPISARV